MIKNNGIHIIILKHLHIHALLLHVGNIVNSCLILILDLRRSILAFLGCACLLLFLLLLIRL